LLERESNVAEMLQGLSVAEVTKTFGDASFLCKTEILGEFRYVETFMLAAFELGSAGG
jgi:hypothetical protein